MTSIASQPVRMTRVPVVSRERSSLENGNGAGDRQRLIVGAVEHGSGRMIAPPLELENEMPHRAQLVRQRCFRQRLRKSAGHCVGIAELLCAHGEGMPVVDLVADLAADSQ